jgi:hypothetical protein
MFAKLALTEEEKTVDEQLGYPHGYAKLCRCHASTAELQHGLQLTPFTEGPPQRFLPYSPQAEDVSFLSENRKKHTHAQITYRNCALHLKLLPKTGSTRTHNFVYVPTLSPLSNLQTLSAVSFSLFFPSPACITNIPGSM